MDLKSIKTNYRTAVDAEQTILDKFNMDIKNTMFGTFFVLLKEQEISVYTYIVFIIIQFLQTIAFAVNKTLSPIWGYPDITDVIRDVLGYINIVTYMKDTNWNIYVTLFYIGIIVLAMMLVLGFYIGYSVAKKKFYFSWPVIILRNVLLLLTTVLFLPFLDYFMSILGCVTDSNDKKVHSYFSEVECWTGAHILHSVFAVLGSIVFIGVALTVSLTCYEYKFSSSNPTARITSRPNLILNIYQAIMVILLVFVNEDFDIILIVVIFIGSTAVLIKFYFNPPYYEDNLNKLCSSLSAVNFWTAIMLVFAKLMEDRLFEGSIIAWLVGVPFVIFINLASRDPRINLLLINLNKFSNGAEIQNQIRFVLKLIHFQANNKKASVLLDGYLQIHKQSCNQEDCPLKQKMTKKNRFHKNLMNFNEVLDERSTLLIQILNKLYFHGIKKFPNDTSLRISYAFFLADRMHSRQQALQELNLAEQSKPAFDEQFVIYRYQKIIEDEIAESENEGQGGLDVVTETAFQTQLKQLQTNIEKSALLYMEFWSQLSEDSPDLAKLNDTGSKINAAAQYVEDIWIKLVKVNPNNVKSIKLYGKFLIEIINDKEAGDHLLDKARKLMNTQGNKKAMNFGGNSGDEYANDSTPSLLVSGEQDKLGLIVDLNMAAASMFGYTKTELINRKIDILMPQIYANHHDTFMENYINTGESDFVDSHKERLVFGKNKSSYIFSLYLTVKAFQSLIQGIQFVATFRIEKNFKSVAYILTAPDGTIDSLSSSCINVLKVDQKAITQKKANIQDFIPNVIRERDAIFAKANNQGKVSATIEFTYPKDSEYLLGNEGSAAQLHCSLLEVIFMNGREHVGFQFKFERSFEKRQTMAPPNQAKISNFQWRYDGYSPFVVGEYNDSNKESKIRREDFNDDLLSINRSAMDLDQSGSDMKSVSDVYRAKPQEEEVQVKRFNYGIGIRTLKLFEGKIQEIEEESKSDNSEESDEENNNKTKGAGKSQKQFQQQLPQEGDDLDEGSYNDFSNTFKSRKAINAVVTDRTPPPAVKHIKMIANFLVGALLLIAVLDYIFTTNELNNIEKRMTLLRKSNERLSEMMNVLSKTRDLMVFNLGLVATEVTTESEIRTYLSDSLNSAKSLKEELEKEFSLLSSAHLHLLSEPVIALKNADGTVVKKGLTQASEEIISRGFEIASKTLGNITESDADYYYLTYNMLNDFYSGLRNSSDFYAIELIERVENENGSFLILLLASIASLIIAVMLCFPILYQINRSRGEVLSLFLDIPEKTVKSLYNKCEAFISNLQIGDEDDVLSEVDPEELDKVPDDDNSREFIPRKKRKHFKDSVKGQRSFFIKFLVVALAVEAYFVYNYVSTINILNKISIAVVELNATSVSEPFYSFVQNSEKQLLIDATSPVQGQNGETLGIANVKVMYGLSSSVLEEHSVHRTIHRTEYTNLFNQILMSDPCERITASTNSSDCSTFADGTVKQGMTVALTKHFENLRALLRCFGLQNSGQNCSITIPTSPAVPGRNSTLGNRLRIMLTTQSLQANRMQHTYIKSAFRTLVTEFIESLKEDFDLELTRRLAVFVVFIIVMAVVYVAAWIPLVSKLNNDIWRTKSMLSMIPLNVIAKIRSIRVYLKKFWSQRNIQEL